MKYFITSDTHIGHRKIIEYGRPDDYEDRIFKGFTSELGDEDVFIHLGDICIGHDEENHEQLMRFVSGRKILVKGNHDHKSNSWYYRNGWDFVCDSFSLNYGGKRILFSHKPKQISKSFDLNIHGHFHTMDRPDRIEEFQGEYDVKFHKLISLENNGYRLTNLDSLIN